MNVSALLAQTVKVVHLHYSLVIVSGMGVHFVRLALFFFCLALITYYGGVLFVEVKSEWCRLIGT